MKLHSFLSIIFYITLFTLLSCKEENQLPTCEITTPANAAEYSVGDNITISADAEDSNGDITEVRFYVNGTEVGTSNSFPYSYLWNTDAEEVGLYTIKATSYDDENASASDEVVIFLIGSQNLAPVAAFSSNPNSGDAPLIVSFTDASTNEPTSWSWDFGDGGTNTSQNPSHTYTSQGQYSVSLTVSNDNGSDSETKTDYIIVTDGGGGNFGEPCPGMPTITDIDGNTYNTVLIGDQCWMKENLKVTHYPNGDAIPYITDNDEWAALDDNNTDDAYCFYDNNVNSEYGALYSYAASIADDWQRDNLDGQGICPTGWHLPTDAEWTILSDYLEGSSVAGGKMKEFGTLHWNSPNAGATNESGFTALPGGTRNYGSGTFDFAGSRGYWWSASEDGSNGAWRRHLYYNSADMNRGSHYKSRGFSVRCLWD